MTVSQKDRSRQSYIRNKDTVLQRQKERYANNIEVRKRNKIAQRKWRRSEKGHNFDSRKKARRRSFNWILMFPNPFANDVEIEYHHIDNAYVVALPKELHLTYGGKFHRENTMQIVKQIYMVD